jgi:uncharacterized protein (TIGR02265 family)
VRASRRICHESPLVGDVDPQERFERFPRDFTMKGMFFSRLLELDPALNGVKLLDRMSVTLRARPALGRYLPFSDYPQVDYSRLAYEIAIAREPKVDAVEAMRRLARLDIETFASSKLGTVVFALVGDDPLEALLKLPDMYRMSLRGGEVKARLTARDVVELEYSEFYGWLDCYPIGHLEALVAHFGRGCEIEYDLDTENAGRFHVHLLP